MSKTRLASFIDRQYRQPSGFVGRSIGRKMARQHQPENAWTVSLLALQATDQVLEVGFGPGVAIELAAAQVPQGLIVGVDLSPTMVAAARRRNARAVKAGRVKLHVGEISALPFADATFDKVFTIHTLYFWQDPLQVLRELRRVLKPGGKLALTFLAKDRWPGGEPGETIAGVYAGSEMVQMAREVGFAQVSLETGPEQKQFREIAVIAMK